MADENPSPNPIPAGAEAAGSSSAHNPENLPTAVIVLGMAGSGKSSLMQVILDVDNMSHFISVNCSVCIFICYIYCNIIHINMYILFVCHFYDKYDP